MLKNKPAAAIKARCHSVTLANPFAALEGKAVTSKVVKASHFMYPREAKVKRSGTKSHAGKGFLK